LNQTSTKKKKKKKKKGRRIQVEFIRPSDNRVVCSACRHISSRFLRWYQNFPSRSGALQCVQIEGDQVVEEESIDLTPKDVQL